MADKLPTLLVPGTQATSLRDKSGTVYNAVRVQLYIGRDDVGHLLRHAGHRRGPEFLDTLARLIARHGLESARKHERAPRERRTLGDDSTLRCAHDDPGFAQRLEKLTIARRVEEGPDLFGDDVADTFDFEQGI